jgi:methyltransferase (TIGR00027 family)
MTLGLGTGTRLAASTAEGAAALRAAGACERDERIRGTDHLAARFVSGGLRLTAIVKVPLLRGVAPRLAERVLPGSYWFEIARVRHMDAVLRKELEAGARQLVILGAGFDTRAHRLAHRLSGVTTFEVDHPATAAVKRERVRQVFGALPARIRYVEADLNAGSLERPLADAGHRHDRPTVVLWSGVSPYLRPHGVEGVLGWVANRTAPGSALIFDYVFREALDESAFFYGAPQLRRRVAAGGEPLIFGIPRGSCAEFLEAHGLQLVSDLGPEELERRYLLRGEHLAGRPYGFVSIAHARVREVEKRF